MKIPVLDNIIYTGDDIMTEEIKRSVLDLRDTHYTGISSVIQTILNYFFSFTWIVMSLIITLIVVAWIVLLFIT